MSESKRPSPERKPPSEIDGMPVKPCGKVRTIHGGRWLTLIPDDNEDDRLWEFNVDTGRIVETTSYA